MTNLLTGSGNEDVDIRLAIGFIRPSAEYGWSGNTMINDYDDITDWREASAKPDAQEIVDAWNDTVKPELDAHAQADTDSETAKTSAQNVKADFLQLHTAAEANYTSATGPKKSAALDIFSSDAIWNDVGTTVDDKLNAIRLILSLFGVAIAFLYLRERF